jgi:GNAT superfamily N-acetyltransferase
MSTLPQLPEGYSPVPPGFLAAVVTYLDMHAAPAYDGQLTGSESDTLALDRLDAAHVDRYRAVYRAVGTPWLWFSRLRMSDEQLREILADERVQAFAVRDADRDVGLLELDFREPGECELAFFGLVNDYVGRGAGRWLMREAITRAWAHPIRRLHVHTCTLDHPRAVSFYTRAGFRPYARAVEVTPDPRLDGTLPRDAGSYAPVIGP